MTEVKDINEARLLAVYRAIVSLDRPELIQESDVGDALLALKQIFIIEDQEKELSKDEMKALLRGFVGGLAATRLVAQVPSDATLDYGPDDEDYATEFVGGPTGGVAVGQGTDPNLVTQSGVSSADKG